MAEFRRRAPGFDLNLILMILDDEKITEINDGLSLIEKRDGLTFGTDAYLLSAYVRRQPKARAADLGSGTGIIPLLTLKSGKAESFDAFEVQESFASLIGRNAARNGLSDRLRPIHADIREIGAEYNGRYDIVTSNPPYMKTTGKRNESDMKYIARHETKGGIEDFCKAAARLLRHGGICYMVWRPDRLTGLLTALTASGLEPKRMTFVHSRVGLPPCLVLCEAKKYASEGLCLTPPLIMYSEDGYTEELTEIYNNCTFPER